MGVSVVGINHRTAPVDVRERFALPGDLAGRLLRGIREEKVLEETMVLDTCNRTEIYFVARNDEDYLPYLLDRIARLKNTSLPAEPSAFYRYVGLATVAHLFKVAASLDSQIVGEQQILGQIKDAYRLALEAGTARFLLNKLLHRAFRVGKRVRTETELGCGSASVPQTAVQLACQILSSLADRSVLLIGAGKTAELLARAVIDRGARHLTIANRTVERARQVGRAILERRPAKGPRRDGACGADAEEQRKTCPALLWNSREASTAPEAPAARVVIRGISLKDVPSAIAEAGLVICSTASPHPVLTYEVLADILRRVNRPVLVIDIAVPRDVDPRLGGLPNVFLYNIDDLSRLVAKNIEHRHQEIPKAQAIVDDEVRQVGRWMDSLRVTPTIKSLRRHFDLLQQAEIRRYGHKFSTTDRRELEQFARSLCNKILHGPLGFLRESSENDDAANGGLAAADVVYRIFGLDSEEGGD